jgi:hypothetical protein
MLLIDFLSNNVQIKQKKVERFNAGQFMKRITNIDVEQGLLEIGAALAPELEKAKKNGIPVVVGVPEEGNVLKYIGLIHLIQGILGSVPLVVKNDNGVYDINKSLDLYDVMHNARMMRSE